jgi:MinD superfamily P-loop ATPase
MQHLNELLNNVEVSRGLILNRKKDAEIKLEDLHVKMQNYKYSVELKFDELVEKILVSKRQFMEAFDTKASTYSDDVRNSADIFEDKIEYLEAIIEQVKQIQNVPF